MIRSRYSAYALSNADYIMRTTHPKSPHFEKDRKKWERVILEFCHTTKFLKLEILESGEDWVHFVAQLWQLDSLVLEEKSHFEKVDGKWLYVKNLFTL